MVLEYTNISYKDAWEIGMKQEKMMEEIMKLPNIEKNWENDKIMQKMLQIV